MDAIWSKIKEIGEQNQGIIRTNAVEEAGVSRVYLKQYVDAGMLVREAKGLYSISDRLIDEYKLLQERCRQGVYSYGTALFFHRMSDRVPSILHLTVPQGYNANRIKKSNEHVQFHYVKKENLSLGIMEIVSPQGGNIRIYDKERCICDLVGSRGNMDMQIYTQAIKEYFKSDQVNVRKIIKYAKQFGVEKEIRMYMEVLL